ncbi:unnamed protein product [Soboliphyme baturini]|uniref:Uncharacterized protein n=1 Tax=Soboliphyme baturini TaxID=241478 RepID=A0A183IS35_9BILA|nr:unnamed protein product [Soboliphyme baturini]
MVDQRTDGRQGNGLTSEAENENRRTESSSSKQTDRPTVRSFFHSTRCISTTRRPVRGKQTPAKRSARMVVVDQFASHPHKSFSDSRITFGISDRPESSRRLRISGSSLFVDRRLIYSRSKRRQSSTQALFVLANMRITGRT